MPASTHRRDHLVPRIGYWMRWLGFLGLTLWCLMLLLDEKSSLAAAGGIVSFIALYGIGLGLESRRGRG